MEEAFGYVNLDWRNYVTEDPRYRRPTEVPLLLADPSEAKRRLGWQPTVTFRDLARIMWMPTWRPRAYPRQGRGGTA